MLRALPCCVTVTKVQCGSSAHSLVNAASLGWLLFLNQLVLDLEY